MRYLVSFGQRLGTGKSTVPNLILDFLFPLLFCHFLLLLDDHPISSLDGLCNSRLHGIYHHIHFLVHFGQISLSFIDPLRNPIVENAKQLLIQFLLVQGMDVDVRSLKEHVLILV